MSPIGGLVVDRRSRKHIIIATQSVSMLLASLLAWVTLNGSVQVWQIFVLSALLGVVNAFDIPARQAFLVDMVGREDLINAIALNSSMFNGARIVGPAIAGLLVAVIGEGWCFFANAISYVAVIGGLLAMRISVHPPIAQRASAWIQILEGFRFVTVTKPIRAILFLLGLVSFAGMPYAVLMPIFADHILHEGVRGLGILMGVSGAGALVAALLLATRRDVTGLGRWVTMATAVFGISLAIFAFTTRIWLAAAFLFIVGFSMMIQMGASNTLIQSMTPDHIRGRVMAVYSMMFMGMAPFGAMFAGFMAERLGAPATIAAGAIVCVAGAAVFGLRLPSLRPAARELIVAQQMVAGTPAEDVS